jgi:hypothetical protein
MGNPIAASPKRIIITAMIAGIGLAAAAARASARGRHTFSYRAGGGHRVVVDIRASLDGRNGVCETSFRAQQPPPPPPPPAPPPMMPVPAPPPTMMAPTPTPMAPTPTPMM